MKSQEIGIKPTLHVVLAADNQMLDEVMVVAYGTAKKSSFTGAASSVNAEKVLKDVPVTSFEQALQGATTGLTVNSSSGQPGAGLSIRIRGTGSMNATNEPLYVIDGVPVISGDIAVSGVSNDSKAFNIMSSINPSDIENITVLKDAAAASLYGSRAANGVILITTKAKLRSILKRTGVFPTGLLKTGKLFQENSSTNLPMKHITMKVFYTKICQKKKQEFTHKKVQILSLL